MSITLPTNFPTGDRRTVRIALPPVLDPLHNPTRAPMPPMPVDMALRIARSVLEKDESASIHDHMAMLCAATELEGSLRDVLAALDTERAA